MTAHNKEASPVTEIFISGAKGLAIGIISAAILLFAFAAIAYRTENPDSLTSPLGYAALYLSAAIAGGCASRFLGDTGIASMITGAVSGAMLLLLVLLMSFLPAEAPANSLSPIVCVLMYAAIPAVSALSGFLLKKRQSRRIRPRRRR